MSIHYKRYVNHVKYCLLTFLFILLHVLSNNTCKHMK